MRILLFHTNGYHVIQSCISKFPGGEMHVRLAPTPWVGVIKKVEIFARLNCSDDVMSLLLAVDAIRNMSDQPIPIYLTIPYFPYARQDRVCVRGEAFSAKVMAQLINGLNLESVTIWDPHSEVVSTLLNKVITIPQSDLFMHCPELINALQQNELILVAPDKGASLKTRTLHQQLQLTTPIIQASKKRDPVTGKIQSIKIDNDVSGKSLLIVDDICDGGSTFLNLAEKLKQAGAKRISLFITHGIFSQGLAVFEGLIDRIYCTDSIKPQNAYPAANNLQVIGLYPISEVL